MRIVAFFLCLTCMMCIISCSGKTTSYKTIGGFKYKVVTREAEKPEIITKKVGNESFFSWWGSDDEKEKKDTNQDKKDIKQQDIIKEEAAKENTKSQQVNLRRKRLQLRRNRYLLLQGG